MGQLFTQTFTNQTTSWLVHSWSNLIPNPSFGHNLCLKYPNGSYEPILDIYISKKIQWYKEFFNPMIFYSYNCLLKIQESIRTPTPKVGVHLGVWGFICSYSPTLPGAWNVTPGLHFWLAPLIVSPCLGPRLKLRQNIYWFPKNITCSRKGKEEIGWWTFIVPWSCDMKIVHHLMLANVFH
jgi:hypothetical protein